MRAKPLVIVAGVLLISAAGFGLWRRGAHEVAAPSTQSLAAWPAPQPASDDWPWWRGPRGNGFAEGNPPLKWSVTQIESETAYDNVAWHTPVAGRGHSSPIVWGNHIFLTTVDESLQAISLLCIDRPTGKQLWRCELQRGGLPKIHAKNSHASATPACDGRHVYVPIVANDTLWMTAVTLGGDIAWRTNAGPYRSDEGFAASPALFDSLVFVAADSRGPALDRLTGSAFLAALDRRSGDIVWRVKRSSLNSYGTPIVGKVGGRNQLLLTGGRYIASYDPLTGTQLWQHDWPVERTAGTPAFDNERIFASGTIWENTVVSLRATQATASDSRQQWKLSRGAADVPSLLVLGERLYVLDDGGILTCCSTAEGRVLWKKRLHGNFSASPVSAAGRLYLANEVGITFVVDAKTGKILSENPLLEPIYATPAICGDELLVRTESTLYSLRNIKTPRQPLSQSSPIVDSTARNNAN